MGNALAKLFSMAYVLAGGLIALGAWLILDRNRFALENARWHRTKMPDSADPKVRRLSAFGFALLGVVIGGTGLYVIALIAKATP